MAVRLHLAVGFVAEFRPVELAADVRPRRAVERIREAQLENVLPDAQEDARRAAERDEPAGNRLRELAVAAHGEAQDVLRRRFVAREMQEEVVGRVVDQHQPRHLLEGFRRELEFRLRFAREVLHAARDEALPLPRDRRLASVEAQETGPRGERAHLGVERHAERLEAGRERGDVEDDALRLGRDGRFGQVDVELHGRHDALDALHPQPAVGVPFDRHDRGLAAERTGFLPADGHRTPAEVGDEEVALRRVDEAAVAGALQRAVVVVLRGEERLRVALVGPPDAHRARELHAVPVGRAALGDHEVVEAVLLEDVGSLRAERGRARVDELRGTDEYFFRDRILLHDDAREEAVAGTVVPEHVADVFAAVVVVEERRVEAA